MPINVLFAGVATADPTSVETIEGAGRKATFVDPDGNSVVFIEVLSSADG